jgi:hypothetical protein
VETTGIGALVVHGASPRFGIQKLAVPAGSACQAEDAVLEVEVLDQPRLGQALGDLLGLVVCRFERVHQLQSDQSASLTSTGMVQQLAAQVSHRPFL